MATMPVYLAYRPLRVGFCIKDQDFENLVRAMRVNYTFWGGAFSPFIVVDDKAKAKNLIDSFKVDLLIAVSTDASVDKFIDEYPHLKGSYLKGGIEFSGNPSLLDIRNPISKFIEYKRTDQIEDKFIVPKWSEEDPLANLLVANVGAYPVESPFKIDFGKKIIEDGIAEQYPEMSTGAILPSGFLDCMNPLRMSRAFLERSNFGRDQTGLYLGSKDNFDDYIDYWNLRASGEDIVFVDPNYGERFKEWVQLQQKKFSERPKYRKHDYRNMFSISSRKQDLIDSFRENNPDLNVQIHLLDEYSWSSENLRPTFRKIKRDSALANVSEKFGKPAMAFELRDKPYGDRVASFYQRVVLEFDGLVFRDAKEEFSFDVIHCPEMNQFYTKEMLGVFSNQIRSTPNGLAVIIESQEKHLEIGSVKIESMIREFFNLQGMAMIPSKPGLIARQICNQLEGLQGCRVFKIEGVRTLLSTYKTDDWFNDEAAIFKIGNFDPATSRPRFEDYKQLWVDPRNGRKEQNPKDILRYLLRYKVIRSGIEIQCSKCGLKFWKSINEIGDLVSCLYCENREDITPTAFEKKWQFRKSGLFEGDDNQEGAIPVLVSMQQLDTCASSRESFFSFASKLRGNGVNCESDFIFIARDGYTRMPQVLVAECKNRGNIERKDLENLTKVTQRFSSDKIQTFILLAKFADFLPEEIQMIKEFANKDEPNIIMWSARELEPYMPYQVSGKLFDIGPADMTLSGLARATDAIYLNPKPIADSGENVQEEN